MIASSLPPYTHLVNLIARRSSSLLAGDATRSEEYMLWVRSLEQTFGVRIEVQTVLGPEGRPAAVGGTICGSSLPHCRLTFSVDGEETRCALCYS